MRLIVDPAAPGPWNMAVDEALLESVGSGSEGVLRLYRWSPATLSLGYFQAYDDRALHPGSQELDCVRRLSGGGTILHDREWTYCLVLPSHDPLARNAPQLYREVHGLWVEILARFGVESEQHAGQPAPTAADEPFLCFQRRATGDLIVRGEKVLGSAQRRRQGAVMQHGSLLFESSPAAPELPGLADLHPGLPDAWTFIESWLDAWAARHDSPWRRDTLTTDELALAHRLCAEKFSQDAWTRRR